MDTRLRLGAFTLPANSTTDRLFARTMTPPFGNTSDSSRVPAPAPIRSRSSRGTVVCPLAVMVDSDMAPPYRRLEANATGRSGKVREAKPCGCLSARTCSNHQLEASDGRRDFRQLWDPCLLRSAIATRAVTEPG